MAGITNGILNWPAGATKSLVASVYVAGTLAGSTTAPVNTTGANLIVIIMPGYSTTTGPPPTPTDSNSNVYSLAGYTSQGTAPNQGVAVWYKYSPAVGSGHTFSGGPFCTLGVIAVSGATGITFDQKSGSTNTLATLIQPGSITPTANGSLIVFGVQDYTSNTVLPTDPAGWVLLGKGLWVSVENYCFGMWYLLQNVAAPVNPLTNIDPENFQECLQVDFL